MPSLKVKKMEPAILSLNYEMPTSDIGVGRYIDIASDLALVNRKLFHQGMQYAIAGVTITDDVGVTAALEFSVNTAGNNWIIQNAWKKGKALWDEMNQAVLDDNPSIQGKWHDFKVRLSENQASANTLTVINGASAPWPVGAEWQYSTYVVPQHQTSDGTQIDPVTGLPIPLGEVLPAEEWTAALVGPDDVPNKRFSLVKAYEESRATVQDFAPNVPAALPNSFYLQLTDDGSQDPELAAVIADANDQPPYPNAPGEYPGGSNFGFSGAMTRVARGVKNDFTPTLTLPGFTAECGLLYLTAARVPFSAVTDNCRVQIHLMPGSYKGVLAQTMGQ